MSDQKITVKVPEGSKSFEIVHRQGQAEQILNPKPPVKINLTGVIGVPFEFLKKRYKEPDQINEKRCHVIFSRSQLLICLVINENDEYNRGEITGRLETHPVFDKFAINTPKGWEPEELGMFLKMHKVYFPDKAENMDLVTKLLSFEADVDSKLKQEKQQSGGTTDNYSKVVKSNVPGKFKIKIPLFKGRPAEEFEVEIWAEVNGRTVTLKLFSPEAVSALEEIRDEIIDEQINAIRDLTPDIAIIEQ